MFLQEDDINDLGVGPRLEREPKDEAFSIVPAVDEQTISEALHFLATQRSIAVTAVRTEFSATAGAADAVRGRPGVSA